MRNDERFQRAFAAYLGRNIGPEGEKADYSVSVEGDESSGIIKLLLVFKRGVRYCCTEWGCHIGVARPGGWEKLRRFLSESGVAIGPRIELQLKVVVEEGAFEACIPSNDARASEHEETIREGEQHGWRPAEPPPDFTGTWIGYGPDGQKLSEKSYLNGQINGKVTLYDGAGHKRREFAVVDGKFHGTMTQWNASGKIIDSSAWENGTGIYRIYCSSGQLSSEHQKRLGKAHGVTRYWDGSGKLTCTEYYEDGQLLRREGQAPWRHRCASQAESAANRAPGS
jgi:hypothetical protein